MKEIIQIRTDILRGDYPNSRKLVFLSEGYTAANEDLFYRDVYELIDRLGNTFPFSSIKGNGNAHLFSLYLSFTPSNEQGYASSQTQASGRTVFETYFENNQLHINHTKINQYIDELVYKTNDNGEVTPINNAVSKGLTRPIEGITLCDSNALVFILLPQANRTDIELEVTESDTYYSIVTSADQYSEQVILRAVCKVLSLGDEYDNEGDDYLTPTDLQGDSLLLFFPNLYHASNINIGPNPNIDLLFPWRGFFEPSYNSFIPLHKNNTPNIPDRTLPTEQVTYKNIELWEGGGGYRTDVYRSAKDCLMRRKIGDNSLPLKKNKVSLCPICREVLSVIFIMK